MTGWRSETASGLALSADTWAAINRYCVAGTLTTKAEQRAAVQGVEHAIDAEVARLVGEQTRLADKPAAEYVAEVLRLRRKVHDLEAKNRRLNKGGEQ